MKNLDTMGMDAKTAAKALRTATDEEKTSALLLMADSLKKNAEYILKANETDISEARKNNMSPSMIDRLKLSEERIKGMAEAVEAVSEWNDPVGRVIAERNLYNGIKLSQVSVPLGVIGIIFESRPNVTSDCAALCIKAGNACILRGGKEAFNSNKAIVSVMREALEKSALDINSVQLVEDTTRESASKMMVMTDYIDVLIPRGGAGLIRSVVDNAKVPVIETGSGNCHIYIDKDADTDMAVNIVFNAKTSRPSVCNAAEKLLVHRDIADEILPAITGKLKEKNVVFRGDERAKQIVNTMETATEEDWGREYLDFVMGVRIVDSIEEAINHIEKYSTHHSECIVTMNDCAAEKFLAEVDSAAVYHNASTRFTDGGEMGLGAEIGISTQKLHARGPMGAEQLVSYKYVMRGNGQIR